MSRYEFDVELNTNDLIDWIKTYFVENGPTAKAVIGISGGKDSTVAVAALVRAIGADRVIGVLMPQHYQHDLGVAKKVCEHFGIEHYTVNIGETVDKLYEVIGWDDCTKNSVVYQNTPARIRMATLYAIAGVVNGRVVNTCNYSEDYIGYSTKYGDSAGDFAPLRKLTVQEVLAIGDALGVPDEFLYKIPEDGLSGKTDEENFGFSYQVLDDFLRKGIIPEINIYTKICEAHKYSKHKDCLHIPTFSPCVREHDSWAF